MASLLAAFALQRRWAAAVFLLLGAPRIWGCAAPSEAGTGTGVAAETAAPALDDAIDVSDPACTVIAPDGQRSTEARGFRLTLRARAVPGPLTATIASPMDPSLVVDATFDGTWNTFEGSARSTTGRWLDVRGRMTGNAMTVSYAEQTPSISGAGGSSVRCMNLSGIASFALPVPVKAPPPAWCEQPSPATTGIHAKLRIDAYEGLVRGEFVHEKARATILTTSWIYDQSVLDTRHVELAMRVAPPSGLPGEIPLAVGDVVEVEGQYISASVANAPTPDGHQDAVIHYTHAECGYAIIAGQRYD
jgi:hypothetical protein